MRYFTLRFLFVFLLLLPVSAQAQSFLSAHERYGNKGASLKALRDAHVNAGAPAEHGVIDAPLGYGSAVTIPATLDLHFRGAGQIDCGSASTLVVTIQSAIEAPDTLIFKNCPAAALNFASSPQKIFKSVWFDTPEIAAAVLPPGAVLDSTVATAIPTVVATILSDKNVDASAGFFPPATLTQNVLGPPAADACLSDHQIIKDITNHAPSYCDAVGQPSLEFGSLGDGITEFVADDSVAVHAVGDTAVSIRGADASITTEGNNTTKEILVRGHMTVPGGQGQSSTRLHCMELVNINSTSVSTFATTTCLIPANATVISIPVRVVTAVGGTPTLTVTATTSGTFFQSGTSIATTLNNTDPGNKPGSASYSGVAQQSVTLGLSANPSNTLGQVRVDIFYELSTPATS